MTTTPICTPPSTIIVQSTSTLWRQLFGKVELVVIAWNDIKNAHEVETVHSATAKRAYIYYHGRRFEAMKEDLFRFLPRNDHEGNWQVLAPPESDPTLEATVQHVHAMEGVDEEVKGELRAS